MIVDTTQGPVRGREKEDVLLFAGVPYAAPPVGDLRFRAAQPHPAWQEPRDALKFGPAAPQVSSGGMTDAVPVRWDEDCLTLNVQTPAADSKRRPVLVWIHGGGYRTGQGAVPWYNGSRFAANGDIVTVTINYRLGALGFTDLSAFGSEYATSGVNGTLDQITALEWVRDNIAAFGGDPDNVTIAGESAGGFSVGTLIGSPRANGLFQRAIPQSGAAHHTLPAEAGAKVTAAFLKALGTDSLVGLLGASPDDILKAQGEASVVLEGGPGLTGPLGVAVSAFYPVVGNAVLPQSPLDAIRAGAGSNIAILTGSNHDETTLWGYGKVDAEKLERAAAGLSGGNAATLLDVYRTSRPAADDNDLMIAITTDHMFRIPGIRLCEAHGANGGDCWLYQFNWQSRAFDGRLKATHALEIPFAFDNLERAGVDAFLGDGPRPQHVADAMHAAWTQFIRTGDPGWPRYAPPARTTMVFDDTSAVADDPEATERAVWEGLR